MAPRQHTLRFRAPRSTFGAPACLALMLCPLGVAACNAGAEPAKDAGDAPVHVPPAASEAVSAAPAKAPSPSPMGLGYLKPGGWLYPTKKAAKAHGGWKGKLMLKPLRGNWPEREQGALQLTATATPGVFRATRAEQGSVHKSGPKVLRGVGFRGYVHKSDLSLVISKQVVIPFPDGTSLLLYPGHPVMTGANGAIFSRTPRLKDIPLPKDSLSLGKLWSAQPKLQTATPKHLLECGSNGPPTSPKDPRTSEYSCTLRGGASGLKMGGRPLGFSKEELKDACSRPAAQWVFGAGSAAWLARINLWLAEANVLVTVDQLDETVGCLTGRGGAGVIYLKNNASLSDGGGGKLGNADKGARPLSPYEKRGDEYCGGLPPFAAPVCVPASEATLPLH